MPNRSPKLAFCLFKFFYFGGLARDFLSIARECRNRGYSISVYTMEWCGEVPNGFQVISLPNNGWTNHGRNQTFIRQVAYLLAKENHDLVIGFNKMPALDVYYAADPCFAEKASNKNWLSRKSGRFKHYMDCEKAVFAKGSNTISLMISKVEKRLFEKHYGTAAERLICLPPGISRDRIAPTNSEEIRHIFRDELNIAVDEKIVLMVGTAFKTKGLDRAIKGLASLPQELRFKTRLLVVGQDNEKPFVRLAENLGVEDRVYFFSGRNDVPRFLLGSDLLLQPSYSENTGTAILEAIVSGLPVLATDVCGYAFHILEANAGKVIRTPFNHDEFSGLLEEMLTSEYRDFWSRNGLAYSKKEDLFSMPEKAADIIEKLALKKARRLSILGSKAKQN